MIHRRNFLKFLVCGAGLSTLACLQSHGRLLNFYNWSKFVADTTIPDFEKRTGIRVNYEEFSSADVMYAKLKIGVTGYDLVVAPDYMVRRMIRQGLLAELDPKPDLSGYMPGLLAPPWDPDQRYCIPYLWGTTGIAYNKSKVKNPGDSWNLLWDESLRRRITILDEKRDAIGMALFREGFSGNSTDAKELAQAKGALLEQRPLVRRYTSDFTDDLVRGETWAALGWSGDVSQARDANPNIDYFVPKEGSFLFVDSLVIPKTAPHPEAAHKFLAYLAEPKVAADITDKVGYANPIVASKALVRPELIDSPLGFPPTDLIERLVYQADIGADERQWDRIWAEVKL